MRHVLDLAEGRDRRIDLSSTCTDAGHVALNAEERGVVAHVSRESRGTTVDTKGFGEQVALMIGDAEVVENERVPMRSETSRLRESSSAARRYSN